MGCGSSKGNQTANVEKPQGKDQFAGELRDAEPKQIPVNETIEEKIARLKNEKSALTRKLVADSETYERIYKNGVGSDDPQDVGKAVQAAYRLGIINQFDRKSQTAPNLKVSVEAFENAMKVIVELEQTKSDIYSNCLMIQTEVNQFMGKYNTKQLEEELVNNFKKVLEIKTEMHGEDSPEVGMVQVMMYKACYSEDTEQINLLKEGTTKCLKSMKDYGFFGLYGSWILGDKLVSIDDYKKCVDAFDAMIEGQNPKNFYLAAINEFNEMHIRTLVAQASKELVKFYTKGESDQEAEKLKTLYMVKFCEAVVDHEDLYKKNESTFENYLEKVPQAHQIDLLERQMVTEAVIARDDDLKNILENFKTKIDNVKSGRGLNAGMKANEALDEYMDVANI